MVGSCHMTFTPKVTILQLPPSLDASSAERESCLLEGNFKGT